MRNLLVAHIPILIALAFIGNARSQASAPETRAEVKADTQAARKAGDMEFGEEGLKANEAHPERYPKKAASSAETRADVKADLANARKAGQLPSGDLDRTPAQVNPKRYPQAPAASGLTRDEVKAETKAAQRAGDVQVGDLGKTQAEEDPPRYAGAPAKPPKLKATQLKFKPAHPLFHKKAAAASAPASAN